MFVAGRLRELFADHFRRHIFAYALSVTITILGITFGAFAVHTLPTHQKTDLVNYLEDFLQGFNRDQNISRQTVISHSLTTHGKTLLATYLLGLTVIGSPGVLALLFLKGFVIGFSVGFLVDQFFFRGIVLSIAAILPHNLIVIPVAILLSVQAMSFGMSVIKGPVRGGLPLYQRFVLYSGIALMSACFLFGASLIETYITPVFIELVARYL